MHRHLGIAAVLVAAVVVLLAPAAGQAGGSPSIAWSPTTSPGTFDYGAVTLGQTASQTFTLTNSGGSATGALTVALSGSGAAAYSITSDGCTGTALGKRKSCTVAIQFAPTTAGASDSATLTATGKKPPATASVNLTGSGAGTPDLSLSPGDFSGTTDDQKYYLYDFGNVASGTETFTVTNNGTGASSSLILAGCCDLGFTLANDTCTGKALAPSGSPGNTCTFDLTFTAPAGYGPNEPFPTDLQINAYIYLFAVGYTPFPDPT